MGEMLLTQQWAILHKQQVFFLEARSHLNPGASKPQTPAKIKATGATLTSHK